MSNQDFIVIRCPRCGKWTYAKAKQKSRFCSKCEKRFKINPIEVIYADSHAKANVIVKIRNERDQI